MKKLFRILTAFILALALSGGLSLSIASPWNIAAHTGIVSQSFLEATEYTHKYLETSLALKWPSGSLIFPENNDPSKADEVFLLNEAFTSASELQFLHHHLGLQFFTRGQYREAKEEYQKALKFKASRPDIYKNLGVIYFNTRQFKDAEKAYQKALQLDPGYTSALGKLALSLAAQKKYSSAERKFKQAIRAEPSNPDHHLNLGHFYFYLKKNYRGAKQSYQKALQLNPQLTKAENNLREINRKFRKWKDRESDFENSWGNDFDYNNPKTKEHASGTPNYSEGAGIAGTWNEENQARPLF